MQLKGISSLHKMCWVHISVQETVRGPLWGLFPESQLGWETDGGRDSQGSESDTKLKLWTRLQIRQHKEMDGNIP